MTLTDPMLLRQTAWNMRYDAHLSACYWLRRSVKIERRMDWLRIGIILIGVVLSLLVLISNGWIKAAVSALATFLVSVVNYLIQSPSLTRAKDWHEKWAAFAHDLDAVWNKGEMSDWSGTECVGEVATMREREKHIKSNERHDQDQVLVLACMATINVDLEAVVRTK